MELTVITVLRSGHHLHHWQLVETESIKQVIEGPLTQHIAERLGCHLESEIDRFMVVAGYLNWKVRIDTGHHELYRNSQRLAKGNA